MVVGILQILTEYIIRRTLHKQLEWVMVLTGEDIDIRAIDDMDAILVTDVDPITDGDTTNVS